MHPKTLIDNLIVSWMNDNSSKLIFIHFDSHFCHQVTITMKLKRPREKEYTIFLGAANISIDICRIFGGRTQSIFIDMILKDLKKSTNLFHPCPYKVFDFVFLLIRKLVHNTDVFFFFCRDYCLWKTSFSMIQCFHPDCQLDHILFTRRWWPEWMIYQN